MLDPLPDFRASPPREVIRLTRRQAVNVVAQLLASQPMGKVTLSEPQFRAGGEVLVTVTPAGYEIEAVDESPISDQFPILQPYTDMGKGLE